VEGTGAIAKRLSRIPGGIGARVVVGFTATSSLFFLRPPKTCFNLDLALLEDVGTVRDGGGAASSDGDRDCGGEMTLGRSKIDGRAAISE
jgi:hypothetical protein